MIRLMRLLVSFLIKIRRNDKMDIIRKIGEDKRFPRLKDEGG